MSGDDTYVKGKRRAPAKCEAGAHGDIIGSRGVAVDRMPVVHSSGGRVVSDLLEDDSVKHTLAVSISSDVDEPVLQLMPYSSVSSSSGYGRLLPPRGFFRLKSTR